jgi:hypothetical protein
MLAALDREAAMRYPARVSGSRLAFVLFPLAVSATGSALTVVLRFKPPVGAKRSYTSTMTMSMSASSPTPGMKGPMTFTMVTPTEMRVVKRQEGMTTIETKSGKPKVTFPPNSVLAPMKASMESHGGGTSSVTMDEFGKLTAVSVVSKGQPSMDTGPMAKSMTTGLQGVSFPKQAVKVGDTWTSSLDMGKMISAAAKAAPSSKPMLVTFRLAAIENQGGKRLARIAMTMKGSMKIDASGQSVPISMSMSGYSLIEADTGLTVGTAMTSDSTFTVMGNTMKQHMVMTMKSL